ncbi:MAG: bifunctional diaminohydroxyphosphoribosylaminopyrimidine deaminase/5-amino-6-(5-phosphoribosylamino)uracil reductase RibD [Cyclobacteriaceae bacterium]
MEIEKIQQMMDMPITHSHEIFMKRAMELALYGRGYASPNPLVGCVIVHGEKIIGEGWHKKYGEAHAEVNALQAVKDKGLLKASTLYVNLEPCSHTGKTPPCADLIIAHQLQKVIIANLDINPLVAGAGIEKLRSAGISVITDILLKEGLELNKRFFTYIEKKRPYIILKWAETSDGFIARINNDSRWISDDYSRQLVHKWRSEDDAVLVGSGTAWHDYPNLNVRDWSGRNPVRVVIDRFLKLGSNQHLFNHEQKTICYNTIKDEAYKNLRFVQLEKENFFESMIQHMFDQQIQSVIVEGGGQILKSFIEKKMWDEARIFISPQKFNTGIPAPRLTGTLQTEYKLKADQLRIFKPTY